MRLRLIAVAVAASVVFISPATAQQDSELSQRQRKDAQALSISAIYEPLQINRLVPPSIQTQRRGYFGFRLLLGARYDPSIFEDESWIYIGCQSVDPRVPWSDTEHGFYLIRVHALIYELDEDGGLNTDTVISTAETDESDEGICNLAAGLDTTFLEIPRDFDVAVVSLYAVAGRRQFAEVVENVERQVITGRVHREK